MRAPWLVSGLIAVALGLSQTSFVQAQATGGSTSGLSSGTGFGTGSTGSSSSGIGLGTSSGQTGQGIASLGTTSITTSAGKSSSSVPTVIPAASDTFGSTYGNPYAIGLAGVSTTYNTTSGTSGVKGVGFGLPAYGGATTTTATIITMTNSNVDTTGWSTYNLPKNPPYRTVLSEDIPLVAHVPAALQSELLKTLANSDIIKNKKNVFLAVSGSTVYLKGQVPSAKERRVIEGVVRLTPGVRQVINELTTPAVTSKQ